MKTVSIKQVVAKILRTARDIEPDFYSSIYEWIAEGLAMAYTPTILLVTSEILKVKNHIAEMPCGFYDIIAMEYKGCRLPLGGDITAFQKGNTTNITTVQDSIELTYLQPQEVWVSGNPPSVLELNQNGVLYQSADYYRESLDCFHFSFEVGEVTLHYRSLPLDTDGFPLIPDNENLKQHLFYYTLQQLLGAGVKLNNVELTWNTCRQLSEDKYLPRAINEFKVWNPETMHRAYTSQTRLIMPQHFHNDFFKNSEQYQGIEGI